jgi:hypothetical protein
LPRGDLRIWPCISARRTAPGVEAVSIGSMAHFSKVVNSRTAIK